MYKENTTEHGSEEHKNELYLKLKKKVDKFIPPLVPQGDWQKPISPIIRKYYNDHKHKVTCLTSGRRAMKTVASLNKELIYWLEKPGNYCLAAPTWKQSKKIFWNRAKELTRLFWKRSERGIKRYKEPSESNLEIYLDNGSVVFLTGLETAERIEGQPVHGFHITEVDSCKEEMWKAHIQPMGLDTDAWFILDGVPDGGLGWYYDICLKAGGGQIPERDESICGSFGESVDGSMAFYNWWSSDVYHEDRMAQILQDYILDEDLFDQEFKGMFISLKGAAYKGYSSLNNMSLKYNPSYVVHVGWDFNRTPMACTFSHVIDNKVYTFDEAVIDDYTTPDMIDYILKDRFPGTPKEMFCVYPDSTGKSPSANAPKSSIQQIKDAGLKVCAHAANPRVKDRLAIQRGLFRDRNGVIRQYVDPVKCRYLINDFNKVKCDQYGNIEAKQKTTRLTHVSDALSYQNAYLFPFRKSNIGFTQ